MKLSTNLKLSAALVAVFAVVIGALLYVNRSGAGSATASGTVGRTVDPAVVLRDDTHLLSSAPDRKVVLVEFLDFECESCLAMYPTMERIRAEYSGRITFGVRYFPIPRHTNSKLAARVVEAASRQGKFEAMYQRMYETQTQWGESDRSQEPLFRSFAQDIGLDMGRFDSDLGNPALAERVDRDFNEGIDLGVQGTPTLFLNGTALPPMPSYEDLTARINGALAE
ncbi:thioredoxin domain-containing protein [Rhodococcus opacus]|uniref:DsbA family protein n=1 Tax=Rhodococcus opacus TaxID=37919 RepID=UPI0029C56D0B|nr:thioredoxin domain-containing protein [Rhodococcus opacus]MDX5962089.1 thioredoxin domain-containing protein [Rhodococcus opacus]